MAVAFRHINGSQHRRLFGWPRTLQDDSRAARSARKHRSRRLLAPHSHHNDDKWWQAGNNENGISANWRRNNGDNKQRVAWYGACNHHSALSARRQARMAVKSGGKAGGRGKNSVEQWRHGRRIRRRHSDQK